MGYTTYLRGSLRPNVPFTQEMVQFINAFSDIRHMKRDVDKTKECMKKCDTPTLYPAVGLGEEGEFFIPSGEYEEKNRAENNFRSAKDATLDVIDYNTPPKTCPGLWCHWVIKDGELCWNGAEKFYNYVEWLEYIINNFFEPNNVVVNGEILWAGEDYEDLGLIDVKDNVVHVVSPSDGKDAMTRFVRAANKYLEEKKAKRQFEGD